MNDAAAETYSALSRFNETLVYDRTAPLAALQCELGMIAEFDKEAERQAKKWGRRLAISVVVAIVGMIVTFVGFANEKPTAGMAGLGLLACGLGVSVYFGIHYSRWSQRNIEDRRYVLVQELLRHLACDMAADASLEVQLNGNDYHKPEFLSADDDKMVASGATSYRLPWLTLSGQLLDGHRFTVTATQLVKRKERRKRKYTKVKEAVRERVELEVRCKPQKYVRWDELPVVLKRQKLNLPLDGWDLQVTGERVTLTGLMPRAVKVTGRGTSGSLEEGLLNAGAVLGLFVLLYQALGEVRK